MLGQYHAPLHTSSSPIFTQSGTPVPTTSTPSNSSNVGGSSILGNSQNFIAPSGAPSATSQDSSMLFGQNGTTSSNSTSSANPSVMSHAPGLDPNASIFNGVLPGTGSGKHTSRRFRTENKEKEKGRGGSVNLPVSCSDSDQNESGFWWLPML